MKKAIVWIWAVFALQMVVSAQVRYIPNCNYLPPYAFTKGLDASKLAFITNHRSIVGLLLIEHGSEPLKYYQHPSWTKAGYLASIAITHEGNVFVNPVPRIHVLYNKWEDQNTIFKISRDSAVLRPWFKLPVFELDKDNKGENPFGLMSLAYDCESNILYAATVNGSDRDTEKGRIYAIQVKDTTGVILDSITGVDPFGVTTAYLNNEKRLFLGKARTSEIVSVGVDKSGKFTDKTLRFEATLSDLGLRGDDRARKIRFTKEGHMVVNGLEFYFNLIAPTEVPESKYTFKYNIAEKKWALIAIE